ncbi:MAG: hypothetical protein J5626_00725, partial [Lachnospiraceae bacterium]|nr:hypothetical protein [Lachnospiraceae bacterium]
MNEILLKKKLMERKCELFKIIDECGNRLENAPAGSLRVNEKSNRVDYYHYDSEDATKPPHGRYIRRNNLELAKALAQKDYDEKVKEIAETELFHVNELLKKYN